MERGPFATRKLRGGRIPSSLCHWSRASGSAPGMVVLSTHDHGARFASPAHPGVKAIPLK